MDRMFSIEAGYFVIPVFLIYMILLFLTDKKKNKRYSIFQYTSLISFAVYILSVITLTIFPIDVNTGIYANQAPWYSSINFIPVLTIDIATFALNIIMCIPLGVYLVIIYNVNTLSNIYKRSFLFSLCIEITQLILRITVSNGRSMDINDLISNTLGGVLGYVLIKSLIKNQSFSKIINRFKVY